MLSLVAEQQLYLPSQVIINKGDIGEHMYIITRGQAEVGILTHHLCQFFPYGVFLQVISGDGEIVAVMKEGSLFGEVEYYTQHDTRSHTRIVLHVVITSAFQR